MLSHFLPNATVVNGYFLATEYQPILRRRSTNRNWFRVIGQWIERARQRSALADLDDRLLDDIAVTRPQAADEIAKRFWQK